MHASTTLLLVLALAPSAAAAEAPFELVSEFLPYRNHSVPIDEPPAITHMVGAGVCVLDFDVDGAWDLFLPDRGGVDGSVGSRLYRGNGSLDFADVTESAGLSDAGWAIGCAVADVDNDGAPDLFVSRLGDDGLYRNNGDGTFVELQTVGPADSWSTGAAFSDLDLDGLVDLYVCRYIDVERVDLEARCRYYGVEVFCGPNGLPGTPDALLRNEDGRRFTDRSRESGIAATSARGFSVLLVDLNGDRLPEVHVANDAQGDLLFANRGGLRFEDVSLLSGTAYSAMGMEQSGMGSTAADFDGDGDEDIYVTNFQRDYNTLFQNGGGLSFQDVTASVGLALPTLRRLGWGAHFLDVGNDGRLDLFVSNGHIYSELEDHPEVGEPYRQRPQLFRNESGTTFRPEPVADEPPRRLGRGTAVADLDGNGSLDVLVNNLGGAPDLYTGRDVEAGWIRLRFVGTESNREGLGAVARLETAGNASHRELHVSDGFLGSNEPVLHFGVGSAQTGDATITWPSGHRDLCRDLAPRRTHLVKEGVGCLPVP